MLSFRPLQSADTQVITQVGGHLGQVFTDPEGTQAQVQASEDQKGSPRTRQGGAFQDQAGFSHLARQSQKTWNHGIQTLDQGVAMAWLHQQEGAQNSQPGLELESPEGPVPSLPPRAQTVRREVPRELLILPHKLRREVRASSTLLSSVPRFPSFGAV